MDYRILFLTVLTIYCVDGLVEYSTEDTAARGLFRIWQIENGKAYRTAYETEGKFRKFKANLEIINALNRMHSGETEFALNQFADLSTTEFRTMILMPKKTPPKFKSHRYVEEHVTDPLPEAFDWRQEKKVITSVKNQGSAGTCWAFSTVGNIEGQWAMMGKPLTSFSVEQIVECDGFQDTKNNKADCGVFGGWPYLAYEYVKKTGGLETEEDYPYCSGGGGAKGTCYICPAPGYNKTLCGPPVTWCLKNESCEAKVDRSKFVAGLQVVDWKAISQNETVIADQLMKIGPLSVALDATLLQFYHRGVFNPPFCDPKSLDHAVLLVGFGVEKGLFEKKPYWIIKNSWGPKWGQDGYFFIKRGGGTCGINTQVTTAILKA
ncbi:cysteine proteinase 1-like [Liolophura sinensis]|uniref:cysteine proteinase 1-like n=1 Tax=Liolophura sinensis TaxID=3198878 RepID=UPI0031595DDF